MLIVGERAVIIPLLTDTDTDHHAAIADRTVLQGSRRRDAIERSLLDAPKAESVPRTC